MSDPTPAEGEVRVTHVFDAPRDVVFAAWTDPEQVARWWAPAGFDIPVESVEIEPRVGGRFHLVMVQSDGGARFPYRSEIVEISEPERIVLRAAPIDEAGIAETVTRTEETRPNAEVGWTELMANLERLLAPEVRPR